MHDPLSLKTPPETSNLLSKSGLDYLHRIELLHKMSRQEGNETMKAHLSILNIISRCLEALYVVSTCGAGCKGGNHLHEYLAGRCYNLGCAAFSLTRMGYYDESLNHVRSLGEIANLQSLFLADQKQEEEWRASDLATRLSRFGPAKVRQKLEKLGSLVPMDKDTYSSLCEQATHVTPETRPNYHTDDNHPRVGPHQQKLGAEKALEQLSNMLFFTSLGFTKFTFNKLLFDELRQALSGELSNAAFATTSATK